MPAEPTTKPRPQHRAAATIALRGPERSTQVPSVAAESPSITIAREKTHPIAVRLVSKLATREFLKTEKA